MAKSNPSGGNVNKRLAMWLLVFGAATMAACNADTSVLAPAVEVAPKVAPVAAVSSAPQSAAPAVAGNPQSQPAATGRSPRSRYAMAAN